MTSNSLSIGIAQQSFYKRQENIYYKRQPINRLYAFSSAGDLIQNNQNRGIIGFAFGVDDTIYVMYDPHSNELKLSKNEKDAFVIMKNIEKGEGYGFIVFGTANGD